MKTLISLVLTAFLVMTTAPMAYAQPHEHGDHSEQTYHCPMHPEVTGKKGDTCPKCGMNLELVKASAEHHGAKNCDNCPHHKHKMQANAGYDCPMHPEVKGKKGDTCPKCGMNLEPVKAAKGKQCDNCPKHKHEMQAMAEYHCPMHPEVTGKKGDTCPKCGMNLEPVKGVKRAEHHSQHHQH